MKKFQLLAVLACIAGADLLAADRFEATITVAAGATTGTAYIDMYRPDINRVVPSFPCSAIDTVYAVVDSGVATGIVTFATYDYGVATTIATSDGIVDGQAWASRPVAQTLSLYTYPVVQNVVTGEASVAIMNLQTNYAVALSPYIARQVKVDVSQGVVAGATVYKVAVYSKENPPNKK